MEEFRTGSRGPQQNVAYEEEKEEEKMRQKTPEVETMRYKVCTVYMYRRMQKYTDILKILFFLPKLPCELLGRIKCQAIVL
jgi:hypothetical protein